MKVSFLAFCLMVSFVFLFTQCKKDEDSPPTTPITTNYSPLTVGSNWTYSYIEGPSTPASFVLTVTDKDTAINGKTYKVLSSSDNSGNNYLAKIDSNYYRYASFAGIGSLEELYLKDNGPVGSTWTNSVTFTLPGVPLPLTADLTYRVQEKDISYVVNGKTYNDVIKTRVTVNLFTSDIGGGDFYYAKDVGMIESTISLNPPGQTPYTSKQQLVSYEIK
jgi:hypothetical protein